VQEDAVDVAVRRDLRALFDPASVAVVGASDDTAKWGYGVAKYLLESRADRAIHLVNRRAATVLGHPAVPRLTEVDGPVDLVAICIPAAGFLDAVTDALAVGAKAIVAITAGLGETDDAGRAVEAEAVAMVRAAGAVLVGPNCLGIADTSTDLFLTSDPFTAGHVALLSQSGNLALDVNDLLARRGLGISRFVSLGNQAELTLAELVRDCAAHDATSVIAVYAEDLRDGREFVAAARDAVLGGTPVVLLAPGRSDAASRGAASHTGSMTSPSRVVDAVCRAAGVHRVDTPAELVALVAALSQPRRASGRRVAVLTDGGGHGAIAADALATHGLTVPRLSDELGAQLRVALWEPSPVDNPVDLAGVGEQDPASYLRGVQTLLASPEVDAVLMTGYFGGYALDEGTLGPREQAAAVDLVAAVTAQPKPLVVHSIFPDSPSVIELADGGIPVYRDVAEAALAVAGVVVRHPADATLTLPPAAPPMTDTDYPEIRSALADAGVTFPPAALVADERELQDAAAELGFPLVLKATGLLHKSDVGGVLLGIANADALREGYRDLVDRLHTPAVSVERMADLANGVEVIVGVRQDPHCGPIVMVGLGGVFTEVLDDVAVALAPVSEGEVVDLLRSLRSAALLDGARGREPVELQALAATVAALSRFAAAHPELAEVEANPVLASATGALALDARAVRR
jgi:acyl-CoA synthetase (NDP forming)